MSLRLFIQPLTIHFAALYREAADMYNRTLPAERNSGFDLHCDMATAETHDFCHFVSQGCRAVAMDSEGRTHAFWLAPRSSISKTRWRLANSLGLIDATYRGPIKAAIHSVGANPVYPLSASQQDIRLAQLAAPSLEPWAEVIVVDELPGGETARGAGGFGSTGSH
jgi:dUTP pyrophosphatase